MYTRGSYIVFEVPTIEIVHALPGIVATMMSSYIAM